MNGNTTVTMLPLYSELHSVVRDMEADHVIANGGYVAGNAYWTALTATFDGTEWPDGVSADYRWTFARLTVMAVA